MTLKDKVFNRGTDEKNRNKFIVDAIIKHLEKNINNTKEVETHLNTDIVDFSEKNVLTVLFSIRITDDMAFHMCFRYIEKQLKKQMKEKCMNVIHTKLHEYTEDDIRYLSITMDIVLDAVDDKD